MNIVQCNESIHMMCVSAYVCQCACMLWLCVCLLQVFWWVQPTDGAAQLSDGGEQCGDSVKLPASRPPAAPTRPLFTHLHLHPAQRIRVCMTLRLIFPCYTFINRSMWCALCARKYIASQIATCGCRFLVSHVPCSQISAVLSISPLLLNLSCSHQMKVHSGLSVGWSVAPGGTECLPALAGGLCGLFFGGESELGLSLAAHLHQWRSDDRRQPGRLRDTIWSKEMCVLMLHLYPPIYLLYICVLMAGCAAGWIDFTTWWQ